MESTHDDRQPPRQVLQAEHLAFAWFFAVLSHRNACAWRETAFLRPEHADRMTGNAMRFTGHASRIAGTRFHVTGRGQWMARQGDRMTGNTPLSTRRGESRGRHTRMSSRNSLGTPGKAYRTSGKGPALELHPHRHLDLPRGLRGNSLTEERRRERADVSRVVHVVQHVERVDADDGGGA